MMRALLCIMASAFLLMLISTGIPAYAAQASDRVNEQEPGNGNTGLPLPRFAALRSGEVNMRTGPGTRYPIVWQFTQKGLPVEIVAEYEIWRKVRDPSGAQGWVHKSALTGKRTAIITGTTAHDLRESDKEPFVVLARLEPGAVGQLLECSKDWCRLKFGTLKGYLLKTEFWGAYPPEIFR